MSLLLDALKKAAEQKARKSKSSEADADGNADETLLDVAEKQVGGVCATLLR